MDLRHVRYFVALYEEQSVTKAAARLNVVQPAVSTQVRHLEAEFGVMLFERMPTGVLPTAIARSLYPICLEILQSLATAQRTLQDAKGTITGTVTMGVPPSMAQGLLAEYLAMFNASHPSIHVRCFEGYSRNVLDWLRQGVLDFAIVNSAANDPRMRSRTLWAEDLVVVYQTDTPYDAASGFPARKLCEFKLILPAKGNYLRALIDTELENAGISVVPTLELDSLSTVLQMLRSPGWATIVPELALWRNHHAADVRTSRLIEPAIRRSLLVVFPPEKEPTPAAAKFIEGLEALHREHWAPSRAGPDIESGATPRG